MLNKYPVLLSYECPNCGCGINVKKLDEGETEKVKCGACRKYVEVRWNKRFDYTSS